MLRIMGIVKTECRHIKNRVNMIGKLVGINLWGEMQDLKIFHDRKKV